MSNTELMRKARACLDVLKGYVALLDADTLDEENTDHLLKLVGLTADIPLAKAMRAPAKRTLTED